MEVIRLSIERDAGRGRQPDDPRDLVRYADTDRVAEADLIGTKRHETDRDLNGVAWIDSPGVRASERRRNVGASPPTELLRAC